MILQKQSSIESAESLRLHRWRIERRDKLFTAYAGQSEASSPGGLFVFTILIMRLSVQKEHYDHEPSTNLVS